VRHRAELGGIQENRPWRSEKDHSGRPCALGELRFRGWYTAAQLRLLTRWVRDTTKPVTMGLRASPSTSSRSGDLAAQQRSTRPGLVIRHNGHYRRSKEMAVQRCRPSRFCSQPACCRRKALCRVMSRAAVDGTGAPRGFRRAPGLPGSRGSDRRGDTRVAIVSRVVGVLAVMQLSYRVVVWRDTAVAAKLWLGRCQ
jgi:hypothetical protein